MTFELPKLDTRLINALESHVASGYEQDKEKVAKIIKAVRDGKIRITRFNDDFCSYAELAGDCFNSSVNPDVDPDTLAKDERNFKARIRRQGVWVYESASWTGREWQSDIGIFDNILGGNVGYDFFGSGYEIQIMEVALEAYKKQPLDSNGDVIDPYRQAA